MTAFWDRWARLYDLTQWTNRRANAAAAAVDGMSVSYMVGSLAGDDTALLVMRNTEAAELLCQEIKDML